MQSGDKGSSSRGLLLLPLEGLGVETTYICLLKHIWRAYKCHACHVRLKYPKESSLSGITIILLVAMSWSIPLCHIWEAACSGGNNIAFRGKRLELEFWLHFKLAILSQTSHSNA